MKNVKLTPALLAIDALLALVLLALWLAPGPLAHWRNWQAPAPQAPNLGDARAAQLAPNPALRRDYPAITLRPLFAADRKPRASAGDAPTAAAPTEGLDQAKLYGLVDGPSAQGVLLEQSGQPPQFVRRGEKIGDWTLQAIEGRNAIFAKNGQRRTVPLPDSLTDAARAVEATPKHPLQNVPVLPHHPPGTPARLPAQSGFGGHAASRQAQSQPTAFPADAAAQRACGGWFLNLGGLNRIEVPA